MVMILRALAVSPARSRDQIIRISLFVCLVMSCSSYAAEAIPDVRAIYLVPSDHVVRQDYENAIADAKQAIQFWYSTQLGGTTFTLHAPIVESLVTPHVASFYPTK